jgi:tetratricopeptide (TPR) repeat protein
MELNEEQYSQILKYVENGMDATEQQSFELVLLQNNYLLDEVDFCMELQSLSQSVVEKIRTDIVSLAEEKKTANEDVSDMIAGERRNWETGQEEALVKTLGVLGVKANKTKNDRKEKSRIVRLSKWWVAAALFLIFFSIPIYRWYYIDQNSKTKTAASPKKTEPNNPVSNKHVAEEIIPGSKKDTGHLQSNNPSKQNQTTGIEYSTDRTPTKASLNKLYTAFFEKDKLHDELAGHLGEGHQLYEEGNYEEAIEAYTEVIEVMENPKSLSRGEAENKKQILFDAHYYKGQSYLLLNELNKGLLELRIAEAASSDPLLKSKCQWYRSLALLKNGNIKSAEALLNTLAASNQAAKYQQKAQELLKELKSLPTIK